MASKVTKLCVTCNKKLLREKFYIVDDPMFRDGYLPMCSACFSETIDHDDLNSIKAGLKKLNIPYLRKQWQSCVANYKANLKFNAQADALTKKKRILIPFRAYATMMKSLPAFSDLDWSCSDNLDKIEDEKPNSKKKNKELVSLIDRWGIGYKDEEYTAFEKKYQQLKNNYPETTSMHTEFLFKYIRFSVKEEIATAKGEIKEAKEWGNLAKDAATAAKINPSQLTKADLQGGLNSFAELIKEVEKCVDIIPILPQFKYRPNDSVDFTIWCYINYVRDMKSLLPCKYEDIYNFYDLKKQEYIEQYGDVFGIFNGDTTEGNREAIKKFVQLPKDIEDGDSNG